MSSVISDRSSPSSASTTEKSYLRRQPLLDRQLKVVGYRFEACDGRGTGPVFDDVAAALVHHACGPGGEWGLREKLALVPAADLPETLPELLPGKRVVIALPAATAVSAEVSKRYALARSRGYALAIDGIPAGAAGAKLLELADFVVLDVGADVTGPAAALRSLQQQRNGIQAIARGAASLDAVEACGREGFTHFLGARVQRATPSAQRAVNPSHAVVLDLLNKASKNVDLGEIEAGFRRDPTLSFKLLRYINSVGFGLSCQIQSIRHALTILGYKQLYRWLTLLLVTAGEGQTPPVLMKTAVTRGRLIELLGQPMVERSETDNLFIVGVFSVLDQILEQPMDQVLDKLNLPEAVTDALMGRQGMFGPFLELAEGCEGVGRCALPEMAGLLSLDPARLNHAHLEALAWVEQLGI